jgi:pimeloyl-ACP methyl ester carboxylesterase
VVYDETPDFFSPRDVPAAHEALKLLLSENVNASETMAKTLTPAGQKTMQRIYHKQREQFASALLAEIDKQPQPLAAASPAGHVKFLQMPVLLLHGSDDTVIPPTELLWLEREIPKDQLRDALISSAITHVEVGSKVGLRERLALVHWMALVIHEARATQSTGSLHLPTGTWLALDRGNSALLQPW